MNILFLRSNPVNPDSRVEKEVNSLINAGHKVEVFSWDRTDNYSVKGDELIMEETKTIIFRVGILAKFGAGFKGNLKPLLNFQKEMFKWLMVNKDKYDIIHACDFDTALTAFIVSKVLKKKLVYDIFDYYIDAFSVPFFLKPLIEKVDNYVINNADAVIICTDKRKEQITKTNPKYLEVIHNSPSEASITFESIKIFNKKVKVCYVGILQENRFLKEITEVIIKMKDIEFHVGGFGQYEEYFKTMSKENENIFFYGKLPYKKTLELEQSCDLMVAIYNPEVPNHKYAAPNKLYEALMLGKPIIMAKDTGLDYIVKENDIGEVINYHIGDFENALIKLIMRRDEWDRMTLKAKELYKRYSWKSMERKMLELYDNI